MEFGVCRRGIFVCGRGTTYKSCNATTLCLLPGPTTANTSKLRPKVAGSASSTLLLAVVVTVASGGPVGASTFSASLADLGGTGWSDGLFVRGWDDFGGEMEPGV
jgi:hypothetical protein